MTIEERLEKISLDWFLVEPALFKVLCSHKLLADAGLKCPVRCGQRRIEYNADVCSKLNDSQLAEQLKAECIRILLKHPYGRQPDDCDPMAIAMGSNCVLGENYNFRAITMERPEMLGLGTGRYFEAYAKDINSMLDAIKKMMEQAEAKDGSKRVKELSDASGLWQEDAMASAEINEMIHQMEASNKWGSIPGSLVGKIIASTIVKIDYRRVMQSFRAEVLSSKRRLTRMRPNRRSGFQNFGSVYRLSSRLLVAIDVSGSTTDEMVSKFFGIVNKFFKYGIEEIDVIQFDTEVKGEPVTMKKAAKGTIDITGRGGTCFQPIFDYAAEQKNYYQGLVIFTDGYAEPPKPADYFRTPVLWVLPDEQLYGQHKDWMQKTGLSCFITF